MSVPSVIPAVSPDTSTVLRLHLLPDSDGYTRIPETLPDGEYRLLPAAEGKGVLLASVEDEGGHDTVAVVLPEGEARFPASLYSAPAEKRGEIKDKYQRRNQDAGFLLDGAAGVFDGTSDKVGGGLAARTASAYIEEQLRGTAGDGSASNSLQKLFSEMLTGANQAVLDEGDGRLVVGPRDFGTKVIEHDHHYPYSEMGTTAAVAKLWEEQPGVRHAVGGYVGDSRVYVYRAATQTLEQLTGDHHVSQYLSRWLGDRRGDRHQPDTFSVPLQPGDKIMTDGVSGNCTAEEIEEIANVLKTTATAARLVEQAKAAGKKDDDMTVAILENR